jgi:predicted alpha/beta-fold hydrolase
MLKNFFLRLINYVSHKITKTSLLPATIFTKKQIEIINNSFEVFWGLKKGAVNFSVPLHFSTVTLTQPKNFWTYYFSSLQEINHLRTVYTPLPFTFKSADQTTLCGCHFKKSKALSSRALIIFGGNGELYRMGTAGWLFKLLLTAGQDFDIIMFDVRECGNSEGKAYAQGLVEDGIAIFSHVEKTLGFAKDKIDLYGFSLGAAIATLVKYHFKDTQGSLINNRSFSSLDAAIQEIFSPLGISLKFFLGRQAKKLANQHAWNLSPLQAFTQITCPKLLISSHQDPVVRYRASLEKGLKDLGLLSSCDHLLLTLKKKHSFVINHHVQPLSFYNDQHGKDAESRVLDFLLRSF